MHFRKIKRQQSEVYINEPLETDSEGNTLTIADILASNVNIEEETELRINSQKLYSSFPLWFGFALAFSLPTNAAAAVR